MIAEEANQQRTQNENQNKELRMTTEMKIRRMSDVQLQEVVWLWKPYIPFGKITIIQGDPGEGKTTLALRVVSACSTGTALPGMEACAPFDVIYQTAEDGLGSIDFRAAARSVLLVGRLRKEPSVRVIVHDKSSLAPEGKSIAFNLGNESGFYWLDGYEDISSEDILSGFGVTAETKTSQAEEIIRRMLEDGEEIPCDEIFKTAERKQISRRTVNEAKKNIPEIVTKKVGAKWMWSIPK